MELSIPHWGQFITLLMIAVALGMDAFSLGIGLGMKRLPLRKVAWLSLSIGLFHVLMPLAGMMLGKYLSVVMKDIAAMVGGGMLCFLGAGMLYQVIKGEEEANKFNVNSFIGVQLVSLSVSMDSLSAGLSMGLFSADLYLAIFLFGCAGALMAACGLYLGRFVGNWLGSYGEALGGFILLLLGSKFLW
ncbi:manganese efflux pump MntP family protein [Paenactinomyces guangxiensis]|uniref:Manganese efflux pump n=1 Tax=Paenactinomyces guangxiensis TaxID=1490290 RepID=A0A7W1WTU1_9BACL|nr:manganese efflux pump [Paenactinomyces guangxiensis]MBA4495945.1 manganese efflux pump [Paenactinomyces guangxiensis]MBH8593068.1 manganese efflux pump [Paenactinomyces guangxiensis]